MISEDRACRSGVNLSWVAITEENNSGSKGKEVVRRIEEEAGVLSQMEKRAKGIAFEADVQQCQNLRFDPVLI